MLGAMSDTYIITPLQRLGVTRFCSKATRIFRHPVSAHFSAS